MLTHHADADAHHLPMEMRLVLDYAHLHGEGDMVRMSPSPWRCALVRMSKFDMRYSIRRDYHAGVYDRNDFVLRES